MAHARQEVIVGGQKSIASIEVDSSKVVGRGGAVRPQIVVPLGVSMQSHDSGQEQIALVRLRAWLSPVASAGRETAICDVIDEPTGLAMAFITMTYEQTTPMVLQVSFKLSASEFADLENRRLSTPDGQLDLWIGLELDLAALKTTDRALSGREASLRTGHIYGRCRFDPYR